MHFKITLVFFVFFCDMQWKVKEITYSFQQVLLLIHESNELKLEQQYLDISSIKMGEKNKHIGTEKPSN